MDKFTKRSYDGRATYYDQKRFASREGGFFHNLDIEIINELISGHNEIKILEVASGTGRIAISLLKESRTIFGLELSKNMLDKAIRKSKDIYGNNRIHWINGNAAHLPFEDETFDVVVSVRFLNMFALSELKILCNELLRVVKKDGLLVLHFSNVFYGGGVLILRRYLRKYNKFLLRPFQIKYLFPNAMIEARRGTYIPFQRILIYICGERIAMRLSKWISKSPVQYISHTTYYKIRKN